MSRCIDSNRAGPPQPPILARLTRVEEPLGLDLREEHRVRYEEIRARKEKTLSTQTRRETDRAENDARAGQDVFCSLLGLDDDFWEFDPSDCGTLSRADLRDAFDWEDEAPLSEHESIPAYDPGQLPDLIY